MVEQIPQTAGSFDSWPCYFAIRPAVDAVGKRTPNRGRTRREGLVRPLVARLQASPDVDDTERQALGITVRDVTPTPAGVPTTRPLVTVDTSQRLRHVIAFVDELTPTRKAEARRRDG